MGSVYNTHLILLRVFYDDIALGFSEVFKFATNLSRVESDVEVLAGAILT